MTSAKEMFEKLGYDRCFAEDIKVYKHINNFIEFKTSSKWETPYKYIKLYTNDNPVDSIVVSCRELQAIYQQIKELEVKLRE